SVLELISNDAKGLRLPQLSTAERDIMTATDEFIAEKTGKARGLQIFNTKTKCVETWNGVKWIEQCAPLTFPGAADIYGTINITTFVNIMYDFQHQEMYVYNTGSPVSYQWFAKRLGQTDAEYKPIAGAKSAAYTIPADFVTNVYQPLAGENNLYYKSDSIMFACVAEYEDGKFKTAGMSILFIGTNTSGYGEHNGVKYLTLGKGSGGKTVAEGSTAKMKVALLNLGQSADWTHEGGYIPNDDAGDLGDFYQWGRIADGHQNVVWKKGTNHRDSIVPFGATPANTSDTISYKRPAFPSYNTIDHQVETTDPHYGKFIKSESAATAYQGGRYDWYNTDNSTVTTSHDNSLWGNSAFTNSRTDLSTLNFTWTYPSNNPCPLGWRIPSSYNFLDLYRGDGSTTTFPTTEEKKYKGTDNTWQWRAMNNYAIGGVIITNSDGEKLFLPALGYRYPGDGALTYAGAGGYCWSSTYYGSSYAYGMYFFSSDVGAGNDNTGKAYGQPVRGVAEF
ncbi:MAG: hypothetical protein LBB53_03400, partial [Prevotellaceae bacterium]|nr:hypothetical protein [Prevotellaceae bacterium]